MRLRQNKNLLHNSDEAIGRYSTMAKLQVHINNNFCTVLMPYLLNY